MRAFVALAAFVCACADPPLSVRFRVTPGPNASCFDASGTQVTACGDVTMSCNIIVSIRVFAPSDPSSPIISVCKPPVGKRDLCSISSIDLPPLARQVSEQTLEVEILVYPEKRIPQAIDGSYQCPSNVAFDAQGFPVASIQPCVGDDACDPNPAIGGVAFYQPGDVETVVDLGCTDFTQLNDSSCTGESSTSVTAVVTDFDTRVTVTPSLAEHLTVSVGEPQAVTVGTQTEYELTQALGEVVLSHSTGTQIPTWTGTVASELQPACVEVQEDVAQSTAAVRCIPNKPDMGDVPSNQLGLTGTRLLRETLNDVLKAIGTPGQFPEEGLVVGIVLDVLGNPLPGVQVLNDDIDIGLPDHQILYLTQLRDTVTTTGTSTNGIFIAKKAPFGTMFDANTSNQIDAQLGGLIQNKVTIVVLQQKLQPGS